MYKSDADDDYRNWQDAGHRYGWFDKAKQSLSRMFGGEDKEPDYSGRTRQDEVYGRVNRRGIGRPYRARESQRVPQQPLERHDYGLPYQAIGYRHDINEQQERTGSGGYATSGRGYYAADDRSRQDTEYGGSQSFRGRGPRSYQRQDERIREDVLERLTQHERVDASDIDVSVEEGTVTLSGAVDDRGQKRQAAEIADDVFGVRNVRNHLQVRQRPMFDQGVESSRERQLR